MNYLKRSLAVLVLCLLVCSPVEENADTAFLIIQRGKATVSSRKFTALTVSCKESVLTLAWLYRAEMCSAVFPEAF